MTSTSPAAPAALELRAVEKSFGSTRALAGASLALRPCRIHALLGENGAGKTTLARVACGLLAPDSGEVRVQGRTVALRSSADAIALGIGMVQQHFLVVPALTVAENVGLGTVASRSALSPFRKTVAEQRVRKLGETTGLVLDPLVRAGSLGVGAQQRLELLRSLARDPRVLILDEPTAALTRAEADELYLWLRAFADRGGAVALITHKVNEALHVSDDVSVLRQGTVVLSGRAPEITDTEAVRAMVGDLPPEELTPARPAREEVVLSLSSVRATDARGILRLHEVNLQVRAGEIVGIVGVENSGHRELLRVISGRIKPASGRVSHPTPVGFVPEDRLAEAVIPEWSLTDNVLLASAGASTGRLDVAGAHILAQRIVSTFAVRVANPDTRMNELSGGNQQRFVLGRELHLGVKALVVENPTRGLDVRAAQHLLRAIRRAAHEDGVAVVFYSTEVEEVVAVADRIIACFSGRVREVPGRSVDAVTRAMVGVA